MVKHLVMWNFKEDFPAEKREDLAREADARLKALVGQIPGLLSAEMKLNHLPGSSHDLLLISDLETPEDLEAYQVHPLHAAVAAEVIKPATCDRACFDYEE